MGRKKKILIVEDEAIFATSMQRVLIKSGYQEEKLLERAKSVGSSIYLIKPIKPQDLELAINQTL